VQVQTGFTTPTDVKGDQRAASKGQRLIILHAVTKDGLLCPINAEGAYTDCRYEWATTQMDATKLSAEWVFQADARIKDYHKNMDGVMFTRWVEKQLLPAFKARYPGKKMTLILDNAPYHTAGPPDHMKPKSMTKEKCILELHSLLESELIANDETKKEVVSTILTDRPGAPAGGFNISTWTMRGGTGGGPYAEEVQTHLEKVLRLYFPHRLLTSLEISFADEGYDLIFTPPYMPKFQPIERCWAYSKNGVAEEWRMGRSLQETFEDLMVMWYGGTSKKTRKQREPVTKERASRWIEQCEEDMDAFIKKMGVKCSGTVKDLVWNSEKAYSDGSHHDDMDNFDEIDVEDEGV
jgi:hypothetical protein